MLKKILFAGMFAFAFAQYSADCQQVSFKIGISDDGETYTVSMVSDVSWESPYNITSTAQVTLKTLNNTLEPVNIINLQDATWNFNARTNTPVESPEHDYLSFGLIDHGTEAFDYQAGVEIPLFSFQNGFDCQGEVSLMDNDSDAFTAPNSLNANVGNQITVFGAGMISAYGGIVDGAGSVNCLTVSTEDELADLGYTFKMYPNPAYHVLNLDLEWPKTREEVTIQIKDAKGSLVSEQEYTLEAGTNELDIDVKSLSGGVYYLELAGDTWQKTIDSFAKAH